MDKLAISNVTLSFGGLNALSGVSLDIQPGLITSIIGPNGAGKTSLLQCAQKDDKDCFTHVVAPQMNDAANIILSGY